MLIEGLVSKAEVSVSHEFGPNGEVTSRTQYSMRLLGANERRLILKTGQIFTAPISTSHGPFKRVSDIQVALDIYPASSPPNGPSNFIAYKSGFQSEGRAYDSWIGGNVILPDTVFTELMENARCGNYPKSAYIYTSEVPFIDYSERATHWDNVSHQDNTSITITGLDYSYVLTPTEKR